MCTIRMFFDDIMKDTDLKFKSLYDDYKRDGNKVSMKYRIKSGNIDIAELGKKLVTYNGWSLERDWNRGVYAGISQMNGEVNVRKGLVYLKLSFIDTVGKDYHDSTSNSTIKENV